MRTTGLIGLLSLVLKKNNFQINVINFLQIGSTAMGTKVAPIFAVTFMGEFEEKHVYTYIQQPLMYLRYIDNSFIIRQHGVYDLAKFTTYMNCASPHIKFTTDKSHK